MAHARTAAWLAPFIQVTGGLAAIAWLALAPGTAGETILVPLTSAANPATTAALHGWPILARAPLGAVIVRAGANGPGPLVDRNILALAAPAGLCGTETRA